MKSFKNNNLIFKNTLILLITSLIIRILGLLNRIILTRLLGEQGISLYSLILPTIMLFLSLSCFSLNTAMIKVSAKYKSKETIKSGINIAIISSSISSLILLSILHLLTTKLLKQPEAYYPILFSIPLFYLTSISTVLRGYLTGIEKMTITSLANLLEQISRIIFIITVFYLFGDKSVTYCTIAMSIGEMISIIYSLSYIHKQKSEKTKIENNIIKKELLEISIPSTLNSLTSNLTFFLEPILYTIILSYLNFSSNEILLKYSEVTSYAIPLLTLFSFISMSISTAIMPKISTSSKNEIKNSISKLIILCLIPAILISTILFHFSEEIALLLYATSTGSALISKYVWFFIAFYLIAPFNTILLSTNQSKKVFIVSLVVHVIKLLLILILPMFTSDALILSYLISVLLTFIIEFIILFRKYKFIIPVNKLFKLLLITLILNCLCYIFKYLKINFLIQIFIITILFFIFIIYFVKRNNK